MVLKIKDGTRGSTGLCSTCSHSQIIKGSSDSQELTLCRVMNAYNGGTVPFKVVECNEFADKSKPSLRDMREVAWVLSTNKQKKYGFQTPKEWRKNKEEDGLDDINTNYPGAR